MQTIPFWAEESPRPSDLPAAGLPSQVAVAVIGGGYTGLSAARALVQVGVSVAVLEREVIGSGAISPNGGFPIKG